MASRYLVVRYVPDAIKGEQINIGVVAYDASKVRARFLSNWERVRRFGGADVSFLKEFAKQFAKGTSPALLLPDLSADRHVDSARLEKMVGSWRNCIQLSEPRGSLLSCEALLDDMAPRLLAHKVSAEHRPRRRHEAGLLVRNRVRTTVKGAVGGEAAEQLVDHGYLPGSHQAEHKLDAVVRNGVPYFAAHGISFEASEPGKLQTTANSIAWTIADVLSGPSAVPLGILALPPLEEEGAVSELYDTTKALYQELGATVLSEADFDTWVEQHVFALPSLE